MSIPRMSIPRFVNPTLVNPTPCRKHIKCPVELARDMSARLFQIACEHDLEGIVAKHKNDTYKPGTKWLKIRNQQYSQWAGRDELFERERESDPDTLWDACTLVCEDAA